MEGRTGRHDAARRPCRCGFRSPAFSQQLEWTGHGVAGARAGPQGLAAAQRDALLRVPRGCGGLPRRPRLPLCGAPFPARSLLSWAGGRLPTRRCDRGPRAPAGSGGSDQAEAQALGPQTGRAPWPRLAWPTLHVARPVVSGWLAACSPCESLQWGHKPKPAWPSLATRLPSAGAHSGPSRGRTGWARGSEHRKPSQKRRGAPRRGEERRCPAALRVRRVPASVCLRFSSPLLRNGEGRIQKKGSPIPLRPYLRV